MRALRWLVLGTLVGCAEAAVPVVETTTSTSPSVLNDAEGFAALVSRLDAIANEPGRSGERCILRIDRGERRLVADLAPAVSPMPEVSREAIALARAADTVRLVSRFGIDGSRGPYVATFTHHPPPEDGLAIVVVVESGRVFLRSTTATGPRDDGIDASRAVERISASVAGTFPLVVITAAPDTPMREIERVLDAMRGLRAPVALGVVLVEAEELADPRSVASPRTGLCERLPEVPTDAPLGALDPARVRDALHGLDGAIGSCVERSRSPRVARGGRLRIAARIDRTGRTSESCVLEDAMNDDGFRACVLDATRALEWPVPSPEGFVDVVFPLRVRIARSSDHVAACGGRL